MKKTILLSLLALGTLAANAQSKKAPKSTTTISSTPTTVTANAPATPAAGAENVKGTTISFEKTTFEFGTIPQGVPAEAEFVFKNTGKEPLFLQKVQPGCGCTTPYYTAEPVKPGKTGVIKASYNAAQPGGFNKPITVTYNGGTVQLNLAGTVEKTPETSVPENKSTILKK